LAVAGNAQSRAATLTDADVSQLESAIDCYEAGLEPLREFILPGGSPAAAQLHVARCICRRAERRLVQLASAEPIRGELIRYLNRLSDLLFVAARAVNQSAGVPDVKWRPVEGGRGKAFPPG
jgi:cob(I)alamin adenosyltransferase